MRAVIASVLCCGALLWPAAGDAQQKETLRVDAPRPLAEAVSRLQARYQTVITYEDAPVEASGDIDVQPASVPRAAGAPPFLIPRGGIFAFEVPSRASQVPVDEVVRDTLRRYNASGYPGTYELRRVGSTLHVVPIASRGEDGLPRTRVSLLDTIVGVEGGRYDGRQLTTVVLEAVGRERRVRVGLGTVTTSILGSTSLEVPAGQYVARDLLVRLREAAPEPVTWRLLYDPITKAYLMNVHGLRREAVRSR